MGKRNNKSLNQIYSRPLPITLSSEIYGPLPLIFPHNPVSWLYFGYKYFYITLTQVPPPATSDVILVDYMDGVFIVQNEDHMIELWRLGFFGKGTISRSDPTWKERVSRRLNLNNEFNDDNESKKNNKLTNEDVTKIRREERKKFKIERSKLQELEIKQRLNNLNLDEEKQLEQVKIRLEDLRIVSLENDQKIEKQQQEEEEGFNFNELRKEDQLIVDPNTEDLIRNLEVVQLQSIETFFLKFALNVIDVKPVNKNSLSINQLFQICCKSSSLNPTNKFIIDYIVYHRYRSLGWCARSGIKFGCDMLLYKRGPPFSHAEYGVLVSITDSPEEKKTWSDIQALTRVIGGVKKCFVLVYVDVPLVDEFNMVMNENKYDSERERFIELFKLYKVTEVLYRRWVPSKTRD